MPADPIALANLRPYVAPVLLEAAAGLDGAALLAQLVKEIAPIVREPGTRTRQIVTRTDVDTYVHAYLDAEAGADGTGGAPGADAGGDRELLTQAIVYRETGVPSWLVQGGYNDTVHEYILVSVRRTHATVCATDASMRDRIVKRLKAVRRMPRDAITAFVGDEAKALWLNGVHTPTAAKADTKALTGPDLGSAIDPIGDQSYYYSAVRSLAEVPGVATSKGAPLVIGAAPGGARVWTRRAESVGDYRRLIVSILDHATSGAQPTNRFQSLAQTVTSAAGVTGAFALSIVPPDLLSEETLPAATLDAARRWAFYASYDVEPLGGMALRVAVKQAGDTIGTAELMVTLDDEGLANLVLVWTETPEALATKRQECEGFLADLHTVKVYYESGHALAQGRCYAGGYTDQPFDWSFQDFAGYDIDREKPAVPKGQTLAQCIATGGDNSLFAYVCEKMFVDAAGQPHGWLASDDGSMEMADFIHIDPDTKTLTLVHVKASKLKTADRQAAPAEYEVVVSQAVKNLRHLDRRNLVDELKRGKAKKIGAAVWHNGVKQANRNGFISAAEKLKGTVNRRLVVLQPRVTEFERTRCLAANAPPSYALRIKQIETLMLAARASALACGATFEGVGDKGTPANN